MLISPGLYLCPSLTSSGQMNPSTCIVIGKADSTTRVGIGHEQHRFLKKVHKTS